jgi:hypothetical protein
VTAPVLLVAVVETEEQGEAEEPDQAVAQVVRPDLVAVVAQEDKVEVLLEVLAVKAERTEMRQPTVASQTEDIDFANC